MIFRFRHGCLRYAFASRCHALRLILRCHATLRFRCRALMILLAAAICFVYDLLPPPMRAIADDAALLLLLLIIAFHDFRHDVIF